VPYGSHANPSIADEARIRNAAAALSRAEVRNADFATIEDEVGSGDFVYFDPPYAPLDAASFTKYTAGDFGPADQERLLALVLRLTERGALVMLSNSKTPYTEALYDQPALRVATVMVPRYVNRDASKRGAIPEVLVTNFEPGATTPGFAKTTL
jgi:DNA adenine methylase